jgi:hypothetical protein
MSQHINSVNVEHNKAASSWRLVAVEASGRQVQGHQRQVLDEQAAQQVVDCVVALFRNQLSKVRQLRLLPRFVG